MSNLDTTSNICQHCNGLGEIPDKSLTWLTIPCTHCDASGQIPQKELTQPIQQEPAVLQAEYDAMQRSVRKWGLSLLVLSIISQFFSQGQYPFYWVLLLLALLAIFYRSSFMWIIIGVYVIGEGAAQLVYGGYWRFVVGSVAVAIGCLKQYWRYNETERLYLASESANVMIKRSAIDTLGRRFGILACCFGLLAPLITITLAIPSSLIEPNNETFEIIFYIVLDTVYELAILGIGFGVASIMTKTRHRFWAIAGIIPGILAYLLKFVIYYFPE